MAAAADQPNHNQEFLSRAVESSFLAQEQAEGAGARVRRTIGTHFQRNLDPFLMLDDFTVKRPGGFPTHPHRGFETITYVLEGSVKHEDFKGHKGEIAKGEIQWMTAGKGILHSEIPGKEGARGMQLWVNLFAKDKFCEPAYQEGKPQSVTKDGISAVVISGEALGLKSDAVTRTPIFYVHFTMQPGKKLQQPLDPAHNAFVYMLEGEAKFGGEKGKVLKTYMFGAMSRDGKANGIEIENTQEDKPASFVLISGQPLNEPIVQYGPFVLNTRKQIEEAMMDYQLARNGFERERGWSASIDDLLHE